MGLSTKRDLNWIFKPWFLGEPFEGIEDRLLAFEEMFNVAEITEVSEVTQLSLTLLDQLCIIACKSTFSFPTGQASTFTDYRKYWSSLKNADDFEKDKKGALKHAIRGLTWFMVNPVLYPFRNLEKSRDR